MIGWHISIHRQSDDGGHPASFDSPYGSSLAVWQTGFRGREWLDDLARRSLAINLGGNGYPSRYTATAEQILPRLVPKPPFANDVWRYDPRDILTDKWHGKTFMDHEGLAKCVPSEWLLIEVWDES